MQLTLYHGSENHGIFMKNVYFSTCESFASDYGEVKMYKVTMEKTFDTTSREDIERLLEFKNELVDLYDNQVYKTYEEYLNSSIFGTDTWEIFEQYIPLINALGFDSMRIFEGGIENFVLFHHRFTKLENHENQTNLL